MEKEDTDAEEAWETIEGAERGSAKYQISQDQPQNWQEQEKDKQKVGERERRSQWRGATLRCHTAETSFLSLLAC